MSYHLAGFINSVIFLLTLGGLWEQLRVVWDRKQQKQDGRLQDGTTAVLSLNQFASSYLAFFSFFLYGACLERFNHYLVWTRLAASLLSLAVLWEIMGARRDRLSTMNFTLCTGVFFGLPSLLMINAEAVVWCRSLSQALIVVATVILAQGYTHQILLIRRSGRTGAVSIRMHQFFLLKDISTVVFAVAMGLRTGWPLLLLSIVSGLTKVGTLWHFRWARLSLLAEQRRRLSSEVPPEIVVSS
jgi:uncharacterized protein with PQ loop repeat